MKPGSETERLFAQLAAAERAAVAREDAVLKLLTAEDAESARVARLLHDNIGQYVAALQLGFRGLEKEAEAGADIKITLQSLHAITQSVGEELHRLALELRPTSLDDHGLTRSLRALLEEWSLMAKVTVEFDHVAFGDQRLPQPLESTLYRAVREILNDVSKRGEAVRVSVVLQRSPHRVIAVVEEVGVAPDWSAARCAGDDPFANIRARIALLKGSLALEDSGNGNGAVIVRLPVHPDR